jgi:hypothetical protein
MEELHDINIVWLLTEILLQNDIDSTLQIESIIDGNQTDFRLEITQKDMLLRQNFTCPPCETSMAGPYEYVNHP